MAKKYAKNGKNMKKIVIIMGLTSSGKSDLAIRLAKFFDGEIVSADSRQVFLGLDYCSGKVSKDEQKIVPHHLIDIKKIGSNFTLYDFQRLAYDAIDDIHERGKLPFVVGGTGLYVRAISEGYNLCEISGDKNLREKLNGLSLEELLEICKNKNIDCGGEVNKRRLVRLIETDGKKPAKNSPKYECLKLAIRWDREKIYERIKARLEMRMDNMIREIKGLLESGTNKQDLINLGLEAKCVVEYLDGKYLSYGEFFEELFKQERHYAKRQQTWLSKEPDLIYVDADENLFENAKKLIQNFIAN